MAAVTGPARWPSTSTLPGASTLPGQGTQPFPRVRISFDDLSDATPSWTEVAFVKVRSFSVSRGRESELTAFDAGNATVVLDNRNRDFDPTNTASPYYPNVTPMNRIWIYAEHAGEVQDLFHGYIESWDQEWSDAGISDATVTLDCSDKFLRLSLALLPTTSPPRDSYEELIASDGPQGYWRLNAPAERQIQPTTKGNGNPYSGGLLPLFGSNRRKAAATSRV